MPARAAPVRPWDGSSDGGVQPLPGCPRAGYRRRGGRSAAGADNASTAGLGWLGGEGRAYSRSSRRPR